MAMVATLLKTFLLSLDYFFVKKIVPLNYCSFIAMDYNFIQGSVSIDFVNVKEIEHSNNRELGEKSRKIPNFSFEINQDNVKANYSIGFCPKI
jgi:hypothetical protein